MPRSAASLHAAIRALHHVDHHDRGAGRAGLAGAEPAALPRDPHRGLWRARAAWDRRPDPDPACGPAQLPHRGAPAVLARTDSAGDAAVLLRGRKGRHCPSAATSALLSISAPSASSTSGRSVPNTTSTRTASNGCTIPSRRGRPRTRVIPPRPSAGPDCTRPYSASVFNISAMSFGALSPTRSARSTAARERAASPMTPARAASAPITARTAAT